MLFLMLAIVGSVSLMVLLKILHIKNINTSVAIVTNYAVAGTLCLLFTQQSMNVGEIFAAPWFWWGALLGTMFMVSFFVWAASTRYCGVTVTTIVSRAAVALSVAYAFVAMDEQPTFMKIAMLVVIIVALGFALYRPESGVSKAERSSWLLVILLPIIVFLFNGANDIVMQFIKRKLLVTSADNDFMRIVLFYTGAVTGLIAYAISCRKGIYIPKAKDFGWGILLGVSNWLCVYSIVESLTTLEGAIFFPVYHSMTIILVTIIGVMFFREKLSRMNYIGIILALCAIVMLSIQ